MPGVRTGISVAGVSMSPQLLSWNGVLLPRLGVIPPKIVN